MNPAREDSQYIYFECNHQKRGDQIIFEFPSGSFKVNEKDVSTTENAHTLKKGTAITILERPPNLLECKCQIRILPTGREEKISKFGCETTCFGVVLVCHYCVYNSAGVFTGEKSEICGVCVGFPF